ncbi:MAG: VIT1/CCC1 transporter family protein [Methyloceanibacter sp.]|nr:VIT1/CCC1 transporter family protein [Methyloceanibacter sp.]
MEDVLERWKSEKAAAYLASAVAANERDPKRAQLFRKMANAADEQAEILAKDLHPRPRFSPSVRTRVLSGLLGVLSPSMLRGALSAHKVRGVSVYRSKSFDSDTGIKKTSTPGHPWPTSTDDIGRRHKTVDNSGTLRAGVFGVNDGLVSNTCLVMGVAGAGVGSSEILLTGVAGLLAGAFSMAAGEFISMLSQKEMFEHQIAQEREELERYPDEEAEELALIYEARGIPLNEARDLAQHMISDPEKALDVLAREELGLNPDELGSPPKAATSSFLTFSVGASVPLIPYLLGYDKEGIVIAAILAGIALFAVGSALSLFSGRSAILGGGRMLLVGSMAAAATYFIGSLLGATVS